MGKINAVCGIIGALVVIFGLLVRLDMIPGVSASRGMAPIVLGAVIAAWSLFMRKRYR